MSPCPPNSDHPPACGSPQVLDCLSPSCSRSPRQGSGPAAAAQGPVGLGTAKSFAVLGGSTVTNTGASRIGGDLGVSPGTAVTGFPPGLVLGTIHAKDAVAAQAQRDVTTAYNDAAGRTPETHVATELAGRRLDPGVYVGDTLGLTGTVSRARRPERRLHL